MPREKRRRGAHAYTHAGIATEYATRHALRIARTTPAHRWARWALLAGMFVGTTLISVGIAALYVSILGADGVVIGVRLEYVMGILGWLLSYYLLAIVRNSGARTVAGPRAYFMQINNIVGLAWRVNTLQWMRTHVPHDERATLKLCENLHMLLDISAYMNAGEHGLEPRARAYMKKYLVRGGGGAIEYFRKAHIYLEEELAIVDARAEHAHTPIDTTYWTLSDYFRACAGRIETILMLWGGLRPPNPPSGSGGLRTSIPRRPPVRGFVGHSPPLMESIKKALADVTASVEAATVVRETPQPPELANWPVTVVVLYLLALPAAMTWRYGWYTLVYYPLIVLLAGGAVILSKWATIVQGTWASDVLGNFYDLEGYAARAKHKIYVFLCLPCARS